MPSASHRLYSVEIRRPRWPFTIAIWVLILALIVGDLAFFLNIFPRFVPGPLFCFVIYLVGMFGLAALSKRFPFRQRGTASVRDGALCFDGQPILELQHIRGVFPLKGSASAVMITQRRTRNWRPVTIELPSPEEAKAIVDDLKWDESHAAQEFQVQIGTPRFPWRSFGLGSLIALGGGLVGAHFQLDPRLLTPFIVVLSLIALIPRLMQVTMTRVRVGTDGLLVTVATKKRFISHQEIASVTRSENALTIGLVSGESIRCGWGGQGLFADGARSLTRKLTDISPLDAFFERIEKTRTLYSQRPEIRTQLLSALKRDGRDLDAWKRAATAISQTQYRVAATPHAVLESIVRDSAVAPDVRIGAALVLSAEKAPRLRIEDTSAHPELGMAIDAAYDGDDQALERAISKMPFGGGGA